MVVCPGRGSYGKDELRSAQRLGEAGAALLDAADAWRAEAGRPGLRTLDAADRFDPRVHLAPGNVSSLIYALSCADAADRLAACDVVAVCGNSLGWYTALHVAGALDFADGWRIVEAAGAFQAGGGPVGGQLVWPVVDDAWRPRPDLAEALDAAMVRARASGFVAPSVRLGGSLVVAGDDAGLAGLASALPRVERGGVAYPLRLAGHSAFHTPLMAPMADHLEATAAGLSWRAPAVSLVDGRGVIRRPLVTRPEELREYTLQTQVVTVYDFAASVRTALREFAPEVLVLLGPGAALGGALGQLLALEGWSGIRSKEEFKRRQASARPILRCAV